MIVVQTLKPSMNLEKRKKDVIPYTLRHYLFPFIKFFKYFIFIDYYLTRLYGRRIFKDRDYRKEELRKWVAYNLYSVWNNLKGERLLEIEVIKRRFIPSLNHPHYTLLLIKLI